MNTYTDPQILTIGVIEGWADPETDPTTIDWAHRQNNALIRFDLDAGGWPVNPFTATGIRGRNGLGRWGETQAADAVVTATAGGHRWLLMIERGDGRGWALPGGMVKPGEHAGDTARRELAEKTGLRTTGKIWHLRSPRHVPDPRESDNAWVVTTPCCVDLGDVTDPDELPAVAGTDDAAQAAWVRADDYALLRAELGLRFGGQVFTAHKTLLDELLDGPDETELWLREYVADVLDGCSTSTLRHLAEQFLRLQSGIEMTMHNLDDWNGDTPVQRLLSYVDHLTQAVHGDCRICHRPIFAPHATTELPITPAWHPRRWWQALTEIGHGITTGWRHLRWGGDPIAHTSCRPHRH